MSQTIKDLKSIISSIELLIRKLHIEGEQNLNLSEDKMPSLENKTYWTRKELLYYLDKKAKTLYNEPYNSLIPLFNSFGMIKREDVFKLMEK